MRFPWLSLPRRRRVGRRCPVRGSRFVGALQVIGIFGLVGPLCGGIAVGVELLWFQSPERWSGEPMAQFLLAPFVFGLAGYGFAILYGGIPALLTGMAYCHLLRGRTRTNLRPRRRAIAGAVLGCIVASGFGLLSLVAEAQPFDLARLLSLWAVPGAAAGAACAFMVSDGAYARLFPDRR